MRTLAQVLTEEYSEHGVHVANVVIDDLIDSPGTRALPIAQKRPEIVMDPIKIAEAFYYLHTQDRSCWTHELQLTPFPTKPSFQGVSFPKSSEVQGKEQERRARISGDRSAI